MQHLCYTDGTKNQIVQEEQLCHQVQKPCLIGSLRYLLHTRPDLTYSVGYLSRFMEEPKEGHMVALKHLLRYVAGTRDFGLAYTPLEEQRLNIAIVILPETLMTDEAL